MHSSYIFYLSGIIVYCLINLRLIEMNKNKKGIQKNPFHSKAVNLAFTNLPTITDQTTTFQTADIFIF
jgi:hypothetical protein